MAVRRGANHKIKKNEIRGHIKAIICLTIHNITRLDRPAKLPKTGKKLQPGRPYLRIIGHCRKGDLENRKRQFPKDLGQISNWTWDRNGEIVDFPNECRQADSKIFGWGYSAMFQKR
jgi:hypothetical protein